MFRIGGEYRDTGTPKNQDDQFLRWIRGPLDTGIKNTGGIRDLSSQTVDRPAALIIVSNDEGVSQHDDPWQDTLATSSGYIDYWGDAKQGTAYDESKQNKKIKRAFEQTASGNRERVPPVLVFRKPRSGIVQFCGLCVPDYVEVRTYRDDSDNRIPNYLFHFTVLNTQTVNPEWLHDRAATGSDEKAPDPWQDWVTTGKVKQWPTGEIANDTDGRHRRYEREEVAFSSQFRNEVLDRYRHQCTITGIQQSSLLDIAHILSRSDHPEYAEEPENVLVLNPLHHRAFDADLFTLDPEYRIRASPSFDPGHPFLHETIVERRGEQIELPPDARIRDEFIVERNSNLGWM